MLRRITLVALALSIVFQWGCTEDPPSDGDGDVDSDGDGDGDGDGDTWEVRRPVTPDEPEPLELPRLQSWECPDNWVSVAHESVTDENGEPFRWCEPPPIPRLRVGEYTTPLEEGEEEGDRQICEPAIDGTFPVVGYTQCQPLGDPCPERAWPEIPSEVVGARIYVLAGALNGNGSAAAPLGTINEAVTAARRGDVVVIGAGRYRETVNVDKDLTLWGRCVQETNIDAPGPIVDPWSGPGAITVNPGVTATVRNLRITGEQQGILSRGDVTLEGIWVNGAVNQGVMATLGVATLRRVLVDSTAQIFGEDWSMYHSGNGLRAWTTNPLSITVSESTFEQNTSSSVTTGGGDELLATLEDVLIRNARPNPEPYVSSGLDLNGGSATVRRVVVEGAHGPNIQIGDGENLEVAQVDLEDFVVRKGQSGLGVNLWTGGAGFRVTLRRGLIEGAYMSGLFSGLDTSAETSLGIEDIVVRDTQPDPHGVYGEGLLVSGIDLTIDRALFERNRGEGVNLLQSNAQLHDVVILDTELEQASQDLGYGMYVWGQGEILLERALIARSAGCGVGIFENYPPLNLRHVTVLGTPATDVDSGESAMLGIYAEYGASLSVAHVHVENNYYVGVYVAGEGTTAELSDLSVARTRPGPARSGAELLGGLGVYAGGGAEATITRARIEENHTAGVTAYGVGTSVILSDLWVIDTLPFEGDPTDLPPSSGISAFEGAHLELSYAVLESNAHYGVLVDGEQTTVTLEDVSVQNTLPNDNGFLGVGLHVTNGAEVSLASALFAENHQTGVEVLAAASVALEDMLVIDTQALDHDGRYGRGLNVESGGAVDVSHSQFLSNRDVGVVAAGDGTSLSMNEVLIGDSLERSCTELNENNPNFCYTARGYGLSAYGGAVVTIDDVEIANSAGAGLQLADGGTVIGENLRIRGCPVAVNLQRLPNDYDWETAVAEVLLEGNEVDVDESDMSIPEMLPD